MNIFTDDSFVHYKLGEFVAHTMLDGIIHPDMQLTNISWVLDGINIKFVFNDPPDIKVICIPDCLSADICKKLSMSLISVIRDIKDSFSKLSCFRMGFIAYGGLLGHAIFFNTINNGISSSWYTKRSFSTLSYDSSFLYTDAKSRLLIRNWKKQPFNQITPERYRVLSEYENSKERSHIPHTNRYYLDILYYSRGYTRWGNNLQAIFPNENDPNRNNPILGYNIFSMNLSCNYYIERMAETALHYKHYCTAYGLFNRCLSEIHTVDEIKKASQDGLSFISKSVHMNSSVCAFIMENLDCELFELIWILDELDHNTAISS